MSYCVLCSGLALYLVACFVDDLLNSLLSYCLVLCFVSLLWLCCQLAFVFPADSLKFWVIVAHQVLYICLLYCLVCSLYLFFVAVDLCFYLFLFPLFYSNFAYLFK